ncbi:pirin family protein [Dyadobacter sp. LJ53]|uniref:pirin family protein n=1 Tax=Dyadobacter chenwenxiniae TaxID=2906456 RepID=UPI001F31C2EB|nr:pirin-like C-terminal cupin domain-containing protein [Dyadobacter chenwenxiniae]MCF0049301.1 pirin family protein [Dyadobacter chenwenxiniae]
MLDRKIAFKYSPVVNNGFLGEGHQAAMLFENLDFSQTDPFILLADDHLDLSGAIPTGSAHPHAGIEIAMFIIEGKLPENGKVLQAGDLEFLTTGSGIVHADAFNEPIKTRILQLWITLPKKERYAEPREQQLHVHTIPVQKNGNNEIRVYSGSSNGLQAPTQNHVPITIVDFHFDSGYETVQVIPATYNAFIYVISGAVAIGDGEDIISKNEIAWFSIPGKDHQDSSQIKFTGVEDGTRFVFYAGEPQHSRIVRRGPFVVDSQEEIPDLYDRYRSGKMTHVKNFRPDQVITY